MAISKKELFQRLNGQRVVVTYEGIPTNEDNDKIRESILAHLAANSIPAAELYEDDSVFRFPETDTLPPFTCGHGNAGCFLHKSRLIQGEVGVLTVKSKNYYLTRDRDGKQLWGDIPKSDEMTILPDGSGFTKKGGGDGEYITYKLVA